MKHSFVKAVVNSLNQKYKDFVAEIYNNNLPKALDDTILNMCCDGRYKKYYGDFETLIKARNYLNDNGYFKGE